MPPNRARSRVFDNPLHPVAWEDIEWEDVGRLGSAQDLPCSGDLNKELKKRLLRFGRQNLMRNKTEGKQSRVRERVCADADRFANQELERKTQIRGYSHQKEQQCWAR